MITIYSIISSNDIKKKIHTYKSLRYSIPLSERNGIMVFRTRVNIHFLRKVIFSVAAEQSSLYPQYSTCSVLFFDLRCGYSTNGNGLIVNNGNQHQGKKPVLSFSVISRITLQGTPAAITFSGIFFVITLPAPITEFFPIVTPPII